MRPRSHTPAAHYARARRSFRRAAMFLSYARRWRELGLPEKCATWVTIARSEHRMGLIWRRSAQSTARYERHMKAYRHLTY